MSKTRKCLKTVVITLYVLPARMLKNQQKFIFLFIYFLFLVLSEKVVKSREKCQASLETARDKLWTLKHTHWNENTPLSLKNAENVFISTFWQNKQHFDETLLKLIFLGVFGFQSLPLKVFKRALPFLLVWRPLTTFSDKTKKKKYTFVGFSTFLHVKHKE